MENKPLVSVIMPVYNVEKYLYTAATSVLSQTEKSLELLLVDDKSPDGSGKICDDLAEKDDRVTVIHLEKNGGLGNARNTGISNAKGRYIFFMDSDDTIESNTLEVFKNALEKNPADVTVFGIHEKYYNKNGEIGYENNVKFDEEILISDVSKVREKVIDLENKTLYGYACNKIYSADLLKNSGVLFKSMPLIEDIVFNIEFFYHVSSLNILPTTPYNYEKRINESLTNKFVPDYYVLHRQRVEMILDQYKSWDMVSDHVKTSLADIYSRYIFSALQRNFDKRSNMDKNERKEFLSSVFEDKLFIELSPYLTVGKGLQGTLNRFLKAKNMKTCLAAGGFIFNVKEKLPVIFAKAKSK